MGLTSDAAFKNVSPVCKDFPNGDGEGILGVGPAPVATSTIEGRRETR